MHLNSYLFFNGNCEAAFKFYEQCLDGRIEAMRTHAGTPTEEQVPAEWRDKILHARLVVGDQVLLASDAPPGRYEKPKGYFVHLQIKDRQRQNAYFTHWQQAGRPDADRADLLGGPFWHAYRSIRHTLDGSL